ncbi:MAG TPA: FG-GAP-like repeat-containing protein [Gemmatimonadota bacterium]|nr:FG-GAP-like repeat-containing protein [Gemmatimonadota bacterium]
MTPRWRAGAVLGLALAAACATPGPPGGAADRSPLPVFERRVAPFPVSDADGVPYEFPFLGGFNVPRPQLVDIDGDGNLDLFVQEAADQIMWFERVAGAAPRFEWREDQFEGLEVGEWYRFVDLDGDGDMDLLGEAKYSMIRAWENRGPGADPRFVLVADTLRDERGRAIFSDRQNIPNVVDFDCDGLLDLMLGRLDGSITRYEATAPWSGEGAPTFAFVTDDFQGISIVAQITPSARHGANSIVFADVDADGDKDLIWGDWFEPGLLLLENTGTCENPGFSNRPVPWPVGDPISTSGYNAPTFGDVDGDGDLDAIVGVLGGAYNPILTAADNLYLLEQTESGWNLVTRRLIGQIDVGAESVPAVGDLDGDGDLDILLANKIDPADPRTARIYRFENVGSAREPSLRLVGPLEEVVGEFHYAPALADLDGDGDLDLVVGTWNQGILVFWNEGTAREPRFVRAAEPLVELTRGSHASPALADLDGDGDLDLVAGESSGEINVWRNDGTPRAPVFTLVTDKLLGIDVGRRSAPALGDLNGDGLPDLVIGSESGEALVLWNAGGGRVDAFEPGGTISLPGTSAPVLADLDGDGDLDLIVGEIGGGLRWYENLGADP